MAKRANSADAATSLRIRAWRVEAGLSQTKLAEAAGVSFQQIQKYENGSNRVSAGKLGFIARALGCEISDLVDGPAAPGSSRADQTIHAINRILRKLTRGQLQAVLATAHALNQAEGR